MNEQKPIPSLPNYPQGVPVVPLGQQKPMLKLLSRLMAKRMHLPKGRGKVVSQSVKIKQKKIKYW